MVTMVTVTDAPDLLCSSTHMPCCLGAAITFTCAAVQQHACTCRSMCRTTEKSLTSNDSYMLVRKAHHMCYTF
jgi:hypothetical protein